MHFADLLAGLPDPADFDAAYAALTATEAGRHFLSELVKRNRNADTQMVVGAIARVEAAIRGDPAPEIPAIVTRELTEIAAALDRAAAEVAAVQASAATLPAAIILAAIERVQDIAFVLHERPIEPTLCDALDAAVRDIAAAVADADAKGQGGNRAAQVLRALSRRLDALLALALETGVSDWRSGRPLEAASAAGETESDPTDGDAATVSGPDATLVERLPESVAYSRRYFAAAAVASELTRMKPSAAASAPPSDSSPETAHVAAAPNQVDDIDGDTLDALAALSEEEIIALFS
jgi:hypothetical protein